MGVWWARMAAQRLAQGNVNTCWIFIPNREGVQSSSLLSYAQGENLASLPGPLNLLTRPLCCL